MSLGCRRKFKEQGAGRFNPRIWDKLLIRGLRGDYVGPHQRATRLHVKSFDGRVWAHFFIVQGLSGLGLVGLNFLAGLRYL